MAQEALSRDRPQPPGRPLVSALDATLGLVMASVLFGMMLVTLVDVTGRYGFGRPLPGAVEITELLMGILVFGGLPLVTAREEHVTVSLVDAGLRGRLRRLQRVLVNLGGGALVGFIAWRLWVRGREFASYGDTSSYLNVPLAPVAYFMSVMAALTALVLLAIAWRHVTGAAAPDPPQG